MSEEPTFLRSCPSCGKRFHMKLIGKELVGEEIQQGEATEFHGRGLRGSIRQISAGRSAGFVGPPGTKIDPIVVDSENYQYAYRCGHCGHEWIENRVVNGEVAGGEAAGYTGD